MNIQDAASYRPTFLKMISRDSICSILLAAALSPLMALLFENYFSADAGRFILYVVVIPCGIFGFVFGIHVWQLRTLFRKAELIPGKLIEISPPSLLWETWTEIKYEYTFRGQTFTKTTSTTHFPKWTDGKILTIAVHPNKPRFSDVVDKYWDLGV